MKTSSVWPFCGILLAVVELCSAKVFTPLEIDNHPCTPENLKVPTFTFFTKNDYHLPNHFFFRELRGTFVIIVVG